MKRSRSEWEASTPAAPTCYPAPAPTDLPPYLILAPPRVEETAAMECEQDFGFMGGQPAATQVLAQMSRAERLKEYHRQAVMDNVCPLVHPMC